MPAPHMNPGLEALSHNWAVAVSLRESGWIGFIEAATFIFILTAGLVYLWRIGALRWAPAPRRRPREQ